MAPLADRFELLRPIGRGGMAEVWAARDVGTQSTVAVKSVRGARNSTAADRLRREASVTASIAHPRVVRVYGVEDHGYQTFMVMDLLPGRDLSSVLADGPLPLPRTLDLVGGLAETLDAVHRAGVVHGDVKPSNVMVAGARTTLIDFGIASDASGPADGPRYGTTASMAPELIRADPVTPATDMYGLGCLIFEALTGGPMFPLDSPEVAMRHHAHGTPPRLSESVIGAPARLDALVHQLLAKDPADRPSAAETWERLSDLRQALAVRLQSAPLPAARVSPRPHLDPEGTQPMLAAEPALLDDAA